ncbi:hypothetical protein B0H13DRAFT_1882419 [Mycena leptocephala]|nr:hypothetical protein B0H13DRAFT_1882419 [Mycena leptocephala]
MKNPFIYQLRIFTTFEVRNENGSLTRCGFPKVQRVNRASPASKIITTFWLRPPLSCVIYRAVEAPALPRVGGIYHGDEWHSSGSKDGSGEWKGVSGAGTIGDDTGTILDASEGGTGLAASFERREEDNSCTAESIIIRKVIGREGHHLRDAQLSFWKLEQKNPTLLTGSETAIVNEADTVLCGYPESRLNLVIIGVRASCHHAREQFLIWDNIPPTSAK